MSGEVERQPAPAPIDEWRNVKPHGGPIKEFRFLLNPNAQVPIDYKQDETELDPPFIPMNWGFAALPWAFRDRAMIRRWYRNCYENNEVFEIERQLDYTANMMNTYFFPFATSRSSHYTHKLVQHTFNDCSIEEQGHRLGIQRIRDVWKSALKAMFNYDKDFDYETVTLGANDEYCKVLFKGLHQIWREFSEYLTKGQMRRLGDMWSQVATGNYDFNQFIGHPELFDTLVDEFHFLHLRGYDSFAVCCYAVGEMASGVVLTKEQINFPPFREYCINIGFLDTLANEFISLEKEFRVGTNFNMIHFMRQFYGLSWKDSVLKTVMMYWMVVDKCEELLAVMYASEFGKSAEVMLSMEHLKFQVTSCFMCEWWMMRYNTRWCHERPYTWIQHELHPDFNQQFVSDADVMRKFNQSMTAWWSQQEDPFVATEMLGTDEGERQVRATNWECDGGDVPFSEDLWLPKDGRCGLAGSFIGYDPRVEHNMFPDMVERFKKVYKHNPVKPDLTWQQKCMRKYCDRVFGSSDWIDQWKYKWMPRALVPFYQKEQDSVTK